jgi:hypothetical protein
MAATMPATIKTAKLIRAWDISTAGSKGTFIHRGTRTLTACPLRVVCAASRYCADAAVSPSPRPTSLADHSAGTRSRSRRTASDQRPGTRVRQRRRCHHPGRLQVAGA